MSELKTYTEEELAEHQQLYDEVFTPVWESEGQYCRAGGGQYEKSFAWWAFKNQQFKVDEMQKRVDAAKYYMKNIFSGDAEVDQCHLGDMLDILDGKIVDELEQALKGGGE